VKVVLAWIGSISVAALEQRRSGILFSCCIMGLFSCILAVAGTIGGYFSEGSLVVSLGWAVLAHQGNHCYYMSLRSICIQGLMNGTMEKCYHWKDLNCSGEFLALTDQDSLIFSGRSGHSGHTDECQSCRRETRLLLIPGLMYGFTCITVAVHSVQRYRGAKPQSDCRKGCEESWLKTSIIGSALLGGATSWFSLLYFWYTCVSHLDQRDLAGGHLGNGYYCMIAAMTLKFIIGLLNFGLKAIHKDHVERVSLCTSEDASSGDE